MADEDIERDAFEELERQVERGSMFTQAVLQKAFNRLSLLELRVQELTDAAVTRGVVPPDALPVAAEAELDAERREAAAQAEQPMMRWPTIAVRVDAADADPPEPVDCEARLPVCHGVCCKLKFALSQEEIEAGAVKWDIGHPYVIRQDSTGYCCHNDRGTHRCTVYDARPGVCRQYSCRGDDRIWSDFDAMVLNTAWLEEHLSSADAFVLLDAGQATRTSQ